MHLPVGPDRTTGAPHKGFPHPSGAGDRARLDRFQLRRGLELTLTPDEAASYEVSLVGRARSIEIARKRGDVILAEKALARADGERELTLKPKRKLLRETPNRFKVELRVQESAGQLVYVDDRIGADDAERLLTDAQFETIGEYRNDVTTDRWTARNLAATVAAAIIAVGSWLVATRADRLRGDLRGSTPPVTAP